MLPWGLRTHLGPGIIYKEVPSQAVTDGMDVSMVGRLQSVVFAVFVQRDVEDWLIGFGLNFWCIVYTVGI